MKDSFSRRAMLAGSSAAAGTLLVPGSALAKAHGARDPVAPFRTPYKLGRLILGGSKVAGSFDEKAVDCPFVFRHEGRFYLTYVGFDGTGYQTGIAVSDDLVNWQRQGVILARDPSDPVTRFNVASASILRETEMHGAGELIRVNGEYVCAWHAYPSPGYEEGPAVIGLAFSRDLRTWRRGPPILRAEDGAAWERGGLYKPYLVKHGKAVIHRFTHSCIRSSSEKYAYWRDVGTVDAYWQANIDLTDVVPQLDLYDRSWPLWTYPEIVPPAKFVHDVDGRRGWAVSSLVAGDCIVSGGMVHRSLLSPGVRVHSYSALDEAVVLPQCHIGRGARLRKVILDRGVAIPPGLVVGEDEALDAGRFRRTQNGVCLVTQEMIDRLT